MPGRVPWSYRANYCAEKGYPQLLQAISDPAFTVSGITNAVLRKKLCSTTWGAGRTDKQLSARITRHLCLLRDHGLIRKVPNRHRYHLTVTTSPIEADN